MDEILKTISGYQEQIEWPDSAVERVQNDPPTLPAPENPAGPAVEVIGSSEELAAEMPVAQMASSDTVDSELPVVEKLPVDEELPPVSWFTQPTGLAGTTASKAKISNSSRPALPIVNPESGEPIYDVRDFSSSATRVIEPIPGAFEVEPDLFDFQTIDELATLEQPSNAAITDRPHAGQLDSFAATVEAQQLFMAGSGDMIEIDGNDGFDYIDLACFDVNLATFFDDVIVIDDQQGWSIQIHYTNVKHALFADDLEVDLKYRPSEDDSAGN